jgi:hypothetical protein
MACFDSLECLGSKQLVRESGGARFVLNANHMVQAEGVGYRGERNKD